MSLLVLVGCRSPVQVSVQTQPPALAQTPKDATFAPREKPPTATSEAAAQPAQTPAVPAITATPALTPTAKVTGRAIPQAVYPPSRVVAPAIGLDTRVVEIGWAIKDAAKGISEWQTADYAAGFHQNSALPGWPGNTVLSGHHNIRGKVFARLWELKPGDRVYLYVGEQAYPYRIEDSFIIPEAGVSEEQRRQNARWIAPTRDERLTLVTCWPPNGNSHRVIVIARPDSSAMADEDLIAARR
ncbi:MAG: sortase [Anaerolineae bacterium]|nr:sortase [Anaerolineae bacterium]